MSQAASRKALDPPSSDLARLEQRTIEEALAYSRNSPRKRVIQPFHRSEAEPLHRMLNAVQPGSYIRPHRHFNPPKAEAFIVLRGALAFFTFHDDGTVREALKLEAAGACFGVDLVPGVYHSFIALAVDTVIYEVKSGPYEARDDKAFAPWAPEEGDPAAAQYMARLLEFYEAACGRQ